MARREPLIWLQLLGAAALPLELLLLLLLLAGADPGPVPALERLLAWAIGALLPALLLWRRPADPFSLLLLQTPLRGRSRAQRGVGAASLLVPRLAGALAAALLLPGLWWIDRSAALAWPLALLPAANRLVALLLSVPVLALIVWQLQQVVQAAALLLGSPQVQEERTPLSTHQLGSRWLSLGLPLLLPEPLALEAPGPEPKATAAPPAGGSGATGPVAVVPEQPAEQPDSPELDQQIG